jgi:hypothetical protein
MSKEDDGEWNVERLLICHVVEIDSLKKICMKYLVYVVVIDLFVGKISCVEDDADDGIISLEIARSMIKEYLNTI